MLGFPKAAGGTLMSDRVTQERLAQNEVLYRSVNEGLEPVNQSLEDALKLPSEWVCECADTGCTTRVRATVAEYESVRAKARQFLVYPGHVDPSVEHVVRGNERFTVVEKLDASATVAESTNPRSGFRA